MREFFGGLYGNDRTKKRLGASILENKLPHAFILSGARGSGKKTLALEISAALNCENSKNGAMPLPCRKCNTCRRIFDGNFTDIKYIRRQEDKQTVGVDDIRAARDDMYLSACESDVKIYIVEEAHRVTNQAQNALLKVIEEPPTNMTVFFLAEETDSLLTTVKSRAQTVVMESFSPESMGEYIISVSEQAAIMARRKKEEFDGILMSADGCIGKALRLIDTDAQAEIKKERDTVMRILAALKQGTPYKELHSALSRIPKTKSGFAETLEELMKAIRDMLVLKYSKNATLVFFGSKEDAIKTAEGIESKRLVLIYDILKDALLDNTKNVSITVMTSDLGAKIKSV